jgi:hypothetical protein
VLKGICQPIQLKPNNTLAASRIHLLRLWWPVSLTSTPQPCSHLQNRTSSAQQSGVRQRSCAQRARGTSDGHHPQHHLTSPTQRLLLVSVVDQTFLLAPPLESDELESTSLMSLMSLMSDGFADRVTSGIAEWL